MSQEHKHPDDAIQANHTRDTSSVSSSSRDEKRHPVIAQLSNFIRTSLLTITDTAAFSKSGWPHPSGCTVATLRVGSQADVGTWGFGEVKMVPVSESLSHFIIFNVCTAFSVWSVTETESRAFDDPKSATLHHSRVATRPFDDKTVEVSCCQA